MQQAKKDIFFDPNQNFPLPYTLIANSKKSFASHPLKQPFAYEVYCPISCKKIKIGAIDDKNNMQTIQFNTTSSRWISVFVNNDIKYLVNGHNPAKKDKRKAAGLNWSIYVEAQDKGNIAIFNPFYVDPQRPLSAYTYSLISKAFKPSKGFNFTKRPQISVSSRNINLNGKTYYLFQQGNTSYISQSNNCEDLNGQSFTITDPSNENNIYRNSAHQIKILVNEHLKYWFDQLNEHFILQETGKFQKNLEYNLDQIYHNLNYYLSIDEQLRIKLSTNKNKTLLNQLYDYHPRAYNAFNRLVSFLNYGNTRFNVFKLAQLGFYNKTDMLQDLAFAQNPYIPLPSAEQNNSQNQIQFRSRVFPFSRLTRSLPYPNVSFETCLKSIPAQTISNQQIIMIDITDPYAIFIDKNKRLSAWSGRFMATKLFQLDLLKQNTCNLALHTVITEENQIKVQQTLIQDNNQQSILDLGDIFGEQAHQKPNQVKPAQIIPDPTMIQQLLNMGYSLNLSKQALINVKNQSVAVALDEIQKIVEQQKKVQKKKPKPKGPWFCQACTYQNLAKNNICQICGTEAQVVDQQELQKKIQQQELKLKKQQEAKRQQQRVKLEKQQKQLAQKQKKLKQLQQKQIRLQFLRKCEITYAKIFKSSTSSVNPFVLLIVFVNKQTKKSLVKVVRIGYNRIMLTQFYRYENSSFISNYNRKIYQQKDKSIQSINSIIEQSWEHIEVINRIANAYRPDQYIVLSQKQISINQLVTNVQSDGQNIALSIQNNTQKMYKLIFNDDIERSNFQITQIQNINIQPLQRKQSKIFTHNIYCDNEAALDKQKVIKVDDKKCVKFKASKDTSLVLIEVVEHIPAGKWCPFQKHCNNYGSDSKNETQVVMSQFLPLMVEDYQGSIFSSKYHSTSVFERNNLYISNYPEANFTFKNIDGKNMLIQTVTVISTNKRLQKIYPIQSGLIFTANQLSWFSLAKKKFYNFKKKQYFDWLNTKKDRAAYRQFWEPVAFFQLQSQTEIQIQFKRPAKYIFFLPTSVRCSSQKIDVAALKIDFFGAKGRIQDQEEQKQLINSYKFDAKEGFSKLTLKGQNNNQQQFLIKKRTSTNTLNYLPKSYEGLNNIPLSISTFYQIKILKQQKQTQLTIQSEFLNQVRFIQESKQTKTNQVEKRLQITSYKGLMENYSSVNEFQIIQTLQKLQMRQFLCLILSNTKSFRIFEKILKIIYEQQRIKHKMFQSMSSLLPELTNPQIQVNEYGLKSFLRIFQKISASENSITFKSLRNSWQDITNYVQRIRNKNYTVLRNKYEIQQLILQPQLFSKDYYRLIYPNYIEDQQVSTIVQQPKTQLNNLLYVQKQNSWYYKSYIDLKSQKKVSKIDLYFPKIAQSANRFKLAIKVFETSDSQQDKLLYYRHFNEEFLYQFSTIAYKDKQIYSQPRINYFSIQLNAQTRYLRLQYNYLLVTTLNSLRYKQPTQSLMLYPLVKSNKVQNPNLTKSYTKISNLIQKTFPSQIKHSSVLQSLPPVKYAIDRTFSLYQIYQFPIINPEVVSKQFSSLIDKITTNIMDKSIVQDCIKGMKISQYQFNKKGLDFAYTLLINLLKFFKKMPEDYKIDVELLLFMFDTFVVYEIGPVMKKVMGFISEVYKRLTWEEKCQFVYHLVTKYLSKFDKYKELKQSQKYSLTKVIQKIQQLYLPIGLLVKQLQQAYTSNNRFLVSMLLKILKPNIQKFGLNKKRLRNVYNKNLSQNQDQEVSLKNMIEISFKFNIWVLNNVQNIKIQLLNQGLDLLLTLMNGKFDFIQQSKAQDTKLFINSLEEEEIWKLVFLTLKIKNQQLNKKVHEVFQILIRNTTEKFKKSINKMLLEIIKKQQQSAYTKINGEVSDDLWMNHLQTILQYLDIQKKNQLQHHETTTSQSMLCKKSLFSLDIETAIELLNLPLTPVLWSHALLIIPRQDRVLNAIIKNFKKQYYSSLGKQITKFCEPLAGIRSLQSIHINWLDLVKKIRLQGRSIFSLFIDQLTKTSFGGRQGVAMATFEEVKQLQITSQFLKLVLENPVQKKQLSQNVIQDLLVWYFLNSTDSKGESPASDFLKTISTNIWTLIKKFIQYEELIPLCIKKILKIKKDSEKMEGMFEQKRIPAHSALSLNKRFCKCFQDLMALFVSNDKMSNYFAFQINGLEYIMEKLNLSKSLKQKASTNNYQNQLKFLPEEQFLLEEKILSKNVQKNVSQIQIKSVQDLKQQEFGNNVKLVASMNQTASTTSVDWTVYKKGNKTKIIFLPMTDPQTYFQYPLYVQLGKIAEVRSIKIGFPCASFEYTDKVVVSPSSVIIEGSIDMKSFEPLGQMTYVDDDGYLCNGVKVWALNLQKIKSTNKIDEAIKQIQVHRVKYLKIVVKRPLVALIQGQYSQLNGRPYTNLGVSISFLSVIGDDISKFPHQLVDSCKQITKKTALTILSSLLTESNNQTMRKISNQNIFETKVKQNFHQVKELMYKYKEIVPQIIYTIGANNQKLGDWLIEQFIRAGKQQIQAKIINQIIVSTPSKIYERINYFQKQLFKQLSLIRSQSQAESSVLYAKYVPFMESFCKTLQECYEIDFTNRQTKEQPSVLQCDQQKINTIIDIYDKKYSSPDIKSLLKLLISLIWIKKPLQLSEQVISNTLDLIWKNCSEDKPYFYNIMSALLVSKVSTIWMRRNDHQKVKSLIKQIQDSLNKQNYKALRSQIFLLSILSYHQAEYLRSIDYHVKLYNSLKVITFPDSQIFDYLIKIIQNVVLGYPEQEQKLSKSLIQDVTLLVKRKDPVLQKLFVGLLGVQQQVMVHLKGLNLLSADPNKAKKIQGVPSKILSKQQQKALGQKIDKKLKYHLSYQTQNMVRLSDFQNIISSLESSNGLIIMRYKYENKIYHTGVYCPVKPVKTEQDFYSYQVQVKADKSCFMFTYHGDNQHTYFSSDAGNKIISIFNCDQQQDHSVTFYYNNNQVIRFNPDNATSFQIKGDILGKSDKNYFAKAQLMNIEIFQCRPASSGHSTQSKISELLSKSNQAKAPFTWYRHNQIYIFPSQISFKKLQKLLSAKLNVGNNAQTNLQKLKLQEIQTDDFIIDVTVENPDDYSGQQDFGYIPKMHIFQAFSRLGGINEVLRLGSQSIKDWKNADRKKNFQHYMQELKSFIHLPNFFSLFIKNHTYVTFLFQVAAGMPDDTNSTRNWEQQQVNSSRFIYKILSDIFKFDRSKQLRDMDKYQDFCQIILQKLAQISKQAPRVFKQEEIKQEQNLEVANKLEKKKTQQQKKRKKKGTGYGADNQNSSKWSSAEWLQNKKARSLQILRVVSIFVSFLDCQVPIQDQRISLVIKSSCLLPLVQSALRSSSLLQIAKQIDLFKNYLSIVKNLAKNPATLGCVLELQKNYKPQQTESIHSLLSKLNNISQIFLECLKSGKQASDLSNQATESLALQIQKTFSFIDKAVKSLNKNKNAMTMRQINQLSIQDAYRMLLSNLRFGYIDLKKGATFQHALHSSISSAAPSTQKILRLSQQLADLSSSLPCQHTNSIFVRCDRSRIDVVKILIMGSKDTPYSNGAFMFDLYCDDSYPNNPPKMVISTTGQGKIRFNPNLYSCGKVCLSLLGTWRGSASQNWDPKLSTLLQLFISTQGITMSDDVYFNEPGFDGEQGTQQGDKKNQAYCNIVRLGNVRYAMIDQIKNPPKGFQDVVSRHFYLKRKQIVQQCQKWLQYADKRQASYSGLVSDHNSSWCSQLKASKTKYKQLLQKEVNTLKQLLSQLPEPDLKQKNEQQVSFSSSKLEKRKRKANQVSTQIDVAYQTKTQQLKIEEDVMQDRWSRYIGAMGIQAVKKQASSNVLLIGLKTLGLQIAKNLVLSGLQKLTIVQNDVLDTGSQQHFYMSNLKGKKIQQCIFKIKQLNPYMLVDHKELLPQSFKDYHIVVSTLSIDQSLKISSQCRKENVKFVYSETCGVSGSYFADLGQNFTINDSNGQQPFEGLIQKITCQKQGVVKLLDGIKHPYQDGDYVVFSKVQGMQSTSQNITQKSEAQLFYDKMIVQSQQNKGLIKPSINGLVFQIKVINWNSFSIGDTTSFTPYLRNGLVKNIKIPKQVKYESFNNCIKDFDKYLDPNMGIYDFQKMGDNFSLFVCFQALSKFSTKNKFRPQNWNLKNSQEFVQIVKEISTQYKKSQQQTKAILQFAKKFSLVCQAQLPSISAYLGGLVSQEIIKALTNKYTPINQFFLFHLNQLLQKIPQSQNDFVKLNIKKQEPFRNIKIVVGQQNMNKIQSMKLFVVGAGAIGCELLKNFAMVNMAAKGKLTVTDPDHIQTSNLTRQFLFRQKHVKKPKSATASAVLMQMNQNLKNHISARLDKVCQQTQDIYTDQFFKHQTIVANALDNVKARQYMDKRCVVNKIPLFESGTLGPKGHVQVIVPYKTQNYGSQADPNEQVQIPHCTLKMFPEDVTHCIQWSRDIFGKVFTLNPKALKKIIQSKDVSSLQGKQKQTIAKIIKYRPSSFQDCIKEAVRVFYKYFRNDIRQLLYTYPLDMKTKQGKLFWSLPKRPPRQITQLDINDEIHLTFISSYAVLFARIFSIQYPKDFRKTQAKKKLMQQALKVKVQEFVPSQQKSKQIQEMNQKQQNQKQKMSEGNQKTEQAVVVSEQNQINLTQQILNIKILPEQFQKDQDSNGHIDLIYSMSNLRSRNYQIGECKWIDAKLKAGRIMAALSTTTSVVAALQTLQIIKLVVGSQVWRNAFVNLAVPLIQISQPGPALKQKIGNTQFSVWQDWQFKASSLKDLLQQIKQKYEIQGFNISTSQGKPIFWQAMYKGKQQAQQNLLNKNLSQLLGKEKTALNILFRDLKGQKIYQKVPKIIVQATN